MITVGSSLVSDGSSLFLKYTLVVPGGSRWFSASSSWFLPVPGGSSWVPGFSQYECCTPFRLNKINKKIVDSDKAIASLINRLIKIMSLLTFKAHRSKIQMAKNFHSHNTTMMADG